MFDKTETCASCIYFKPDYMDLGFCRRYPPVWADDDWCLPCINKDCFCGEYKANKKVSG